MTEQTLGDVTFTVDDHGTAPHRLAILTATDADWVARLARIYRELRTARRLPDPAPSEVQLLHGVQVVDVERLSKRLVETQVAKRGNGNFDVVRSDFAEVLLGHVGSNYGKFRYGYISVRDRESARQPGRGIDQVGVRIDECKALHLMLGEAKLSSENNSPPRVVDHNDDALSKSHHKQLTNREATSERIHQAYRHSTDEETQVLFALASHMFDDRDEHLVVHLTSLLVRPAALATISDFGSYAENPGQFGNAVVDFYVVAAQAEDIEGLITEFAEHAGLEQEDARTS